MISDLIEDLAHDKISLSQALTRTKLIQAKLKVEELKVWLANELNGYGDGQNIPDYRKFPMKIVGDFLGPFGSQTRNTPLMLQQLAKDLEMNLYEHVERGSIKSIEDNINGAPAGSVVAISFSQDLVYSLAQMYLRQNSTQHLISVHGIIAPSQLRNILDQTKQKLLDMLLDLRDKFPTFDKEFNPTKENQEKARNIVYYNIYGGTNSSNLAVGETVTQANSTNISIQEFRESLKKAGVPEEEISTIKDIVGSSEPKESKLSKAMRWIGQLSKKMVEKGIELNLPQIIEAVQRQIEQLGI